MSFEVLGRSAEGLAPRQADLGEEVLVKFHHRVRNAEDALTLPRDASLMVPFRQSTAQSTALGRP